MLGENDLLVCFLGSPVGIAPRIGIWRDGTDTTPIELDSLTPGTRRLLAAMSLPREFEARRRLTPRSEAEVLAALARPFQTDAALLDGRGVNATARIRGRQSVAEELRKLGLDADDYFAMATTGEYSAPRVKADVIEVVRAAHEERWDAARRILGVASAPSWRDTAPSAIDVGALTLSPELITDPTAREMVAKAVRDAGEHTPPKAADRKDAEPRATSRVAGPAPSPTSRPSLTMRAGLAVAALVALAVVVFLLTQGRGSGSSPANGVGGPRVALRIYNQVTNGPRGMREDASPVQLTRRPIPYCRVAGCISGTDRSTGQVYEYATCETIGDIPAMTNGNSTTDTAGRLDDRNAGLYRSRIYYGVVLMDGVTGYISDVWVEPSQRNGKLSLPPCAANFGKG